MVVTQPCPQCTWHCYAKVAMSEFGYEKILDPLLHNLVTLEQHGLFIPQLGSFIKGTVQCVIADNLGAHGLAGFVEGFCTDEDSEIKEKEVRSGAFQCRTKDIHQSHVTKAHENWCLLRLLPLMIGTLIPDDEPAWQLILDLKDIVDLVLAPIHYADTIDYLEFKISEHSQRLKEVFPDKKLLPKHHFLEHDP